MLYCLYYVFICYGNDVSVESTYGVCTYRTYRSWKEHILALCSYKYFDYGIFDENLLFVLNFFVVPWWVILLVVVCHVEFASAPYDIELYLIDLVTHPIEAYI